MSLYPKDPQREVVEACYRLTDSELFIAYEGIKDGSHMFAEEVTQAAIRYAECSPSPFQKGPSKEEKIIKTDCAVLGASAAITVFTLEGYEFDLDSLKKLTQRPHEGLIDKARGVTSSFLFQSIYSPFMREDLLKPGNEYEGPEPILISNSTAPLAYLHGIWVGGSVATGTAVTPFNAR